MNTIQANIKVISPEGVLFENSYTWRNLSKKDGSPHLTNQKKMERDLERTRDILNDQYILYPNKAYPNDKTPIEGRKLICNFNIIN